jgi:hypothetical protein
MRLSIALAALLAIGAQPSSCGSSPVPASKAIVAPLEAACQGLACGGSCGYCPPGAEPKDCPVPTFAPTACNARGQCVTVGTFQCEGDPCAGLACGATCHVCPPDALDCVETAIVKACDRDGVCQPMTPALTCP